MQRFHLKWRLFDLEDLKQDDTLGQELMAEFHFILVICDLLKSTLNDCNGSFSTY